MASLPGSRTAGFIASPPAVSRPCGLPFASVVSTFPAPSGKPKPHETSALMSIPGEELHNRRKVAMPTPPKRLVLISTCLVTTGLILAGEKGLSAHAQILATCQRGSGAIV